MRVVPRFNLPVGTQVRLFGSDLISNGMTEGGYEFTELGSGAATVVSFLQFIEHQKLPGTRIDMLSAQTGNRLQHRLGGYASSRSLRADQQEVGRFRLSLCHAVIHRREHMPHESGNCGFDFSIRVLDRKEHRKAVRDLAQPIFGQPICIGAGRGGQSTTWTMPKGRTLMKYLRIFEDLHPEENPLDALVSLDHLKGNSVSRISLRVRELMTQAWEEIGIDTKSPSVADIMKHLEMLIHEENRSRQMNFMPALMMPSSLTVDRHIKELLSATEMLVATKGEREARDRRGRGSTDIRTLVVGEYVEIDECKASLVVSAKARGIWERLSADDRETLEHVDEKIRARLSILVMIDVATRMPLAWVVSDQPRAEATLALFRMATRDKTRERKIYGCSGEPVTGIGLGHFKHDNGPGLRNRSTIAALMGLGATNTVARSYASTDKPYVERMFGTTESILLKVIHGYTGRKPGELPGYDATRDGVLDIDELYGILTRFMIDEYPSMRHMGVGIGGRRPFDVYKQISETRGCIPQIDPNLRRIHLGWKQQIIPTDEGVRVFGGIWFNSYELQRKLDNLPLKVKIAVFVDPENLATATVLLPSHKDPIEAPSQITAFADMTLPEVLNLMAEWPREGPRSREIDEDRVMRLRRERFDQLRSIGVERRLSRSYSTIEECQKKASAVFVGARLIPSDEMAICVAPGGITDIGKAPNIYLIGGDDGEAPERHRHPFRRMSARVLREGGTREQHHPGQPENPAEGFALAADLDPLRYSRSGVACSGGRATGATAASGAFQ